MSNPLKLPSTEDDLIELVKIESEKRFSKEYIDKCNEVKDEVNGWIRISEEMQYEIVRDYLIKKYGEASDMAIDIGVNMLRKAQYIKPDNEHVKNIVYVKNNKANKGRFKSGDKLEDVQLWSIDGKTQTNLFDLMADDRVNIMMAASHT